jgi:hypothetical protein
VERSDGGEGAVVSCVSCVFVVVLLGSSFVGGEEHKRTNDPHVENLRQDMVMSHIWTKTRLSLIKKEMTDAKSSFAPRPNSR